MNRSALHISAAMAIALLAAAAPAQTTQPQPAPVRLPLNARPWTTDTVTPAPVRTWLPPADLAPQPRLLPAERSRVAPTRPAIDRADPATATPPPPSQVLPAFPRAWAPSPSVADLSSLPRRIRPNPDRARVGLDDTIMESLRRLLVIPVPDRRGPVPFARLAIPVPSDTPDAPPIRTTLPDDLPPIHVPTTIRRPTLPAK